MQIRQLVQRQGCRSPLAVVVLAESRLKSVGGLLSPGRGLTPTSTFFVNPFPCFLRRDVRASASISPSWLLSPPASTLVAVSLSVCACSLAQTAFGHFWHLGSGICCKIHQIPSHTFMAPTLLSWLLWCRISTTHHSPTTNSQSLAQRRRFNSSACVHSPRALSLRPQVKTIIIIIVRHIDAATIGTSTISAADAVT